MRTLEVIDHITRWLTGYCENSGREGFAVGVSGGVDSAVTSTLCAKTGRNVVALILPIHQDPSQVSLAKAHAEWLTETFSNARSVVTDLTPVFQSLQQQFPPDIQDELTMANARSRLRMLTLYVFAGHHRMLVAGTGNKVEDFGVGFFTKYGDGGVDLSPIADLLKSEVYEAGRALGILPEILGATPTDGLWPDNRSDENQIGATYAELEWAMGWPGKPADEAALSDRQREVLGIYRRFHRANRHKMDPIPVCKIPDALRT